MRNLKKVILSLIVVATLSSAFAQQADADGPLRRWWRNLTGRNNSSQFAGSQRQTAFSPQVATNPAGLQPGQCMRTCQQTCQRTVVNYVPQTAYRTCYKRVPVTQYRPVTNSDPCTGCTVTCMRPCTTYTYQVQRVPYTTYRPVYRTESYRVPVTTITNGCATGTCPTTSLSPSTGCSTCGVSGSGSSGLGSPTSTTAVPTPARVTQTFTVDPSTGLSTEGDFNASPANQIPTLNSVPNPQSNQRPLDSFSTGAGSSSRNSAPAPRSIHDQLHTPVAHRVNHTAENPIRKRWDYSPVRFASSQNTNERRVTAFAGQASATPAPVHKSRWVEVD